MDVLNWMRSQWDRVSAAVLVLSGATLLVLGWLGVSSTVTAAKQIPYVVSGGLGGLFLLGVGATLWLSADIRDEWRKLDELDEILSRQPADHATGIDLTAGPATGLEPPGAEQSTEGGTGARSTAVRGASAVSSNGPAGGSGG